MLDRVDEVLLLVRSRAPLNDKNYPLRAGMTGDIALKFDFTHAFMHMDWSRGQIQHMLQPLDHGSTQPLDREKLKVWAVKLFGNAAGMCEALALNSDEIMKILDKEFGS